MILHDCCVLLTVLPVPPDPPLGSTKEENSSVVALVPIFHIISLTDFWTEITLFSYLSTPLNDIFRGK